MNQHRNQKEQIPEDETGEEEQGKEDRKPGRGIADFLLLSAVGHCGPNCL